jgi:hypothetical protein
MVPLPRLAHSQRIASIRGLAVRVAVLREFVLGSPAEVEGAQHGNVDAESREHKLDAAEHEGREGGSGEVANEVDDEDLPEANDADDDAAGVVFVRMGTRGACGVETYAAPRAKQEITASFSVLRICSFQTERIGRAKMNTSVRMLVMIRDLRMSI